MKINTSLVRMRGDARLHGVDHVATEATYTWRAIDNSPFSVCIVTSDNDQDIQINSNHHFAQEFVYHDFAEQCSTEYPNVCENRGKIASKGSANTFLFLYYFIICKIDVFFLVFADFFGVFLTSDAFKGPKPQVSCSDKRFREYMTSRGGPDLHLKARSVNLLAKMI